VDEDLLRRQPKKQSSADAARSIVSSYHSMPRRRHLCPRCFPAASGGRRSAFVEGCSLHAATRVLASDRRGLDEGTLGYIEAQVHGPLELGRDVAALVAATGYRVTCPDVPAKLLALSKKYDLPLYWTDGTTISVDPSCTPAIRACEDPSRTATGSVAPARSSCRGQRAYNPK